MLMINSLNNILWVSHCPCVITEQAKKRGGVCVCGTTESFLGSSFTEALDPLYSGGEGRIRRLLYSNVNRQKCWRCSQTSPSCHFPAQTMALFSDPTWFAESLFSPSSSSCSSRPRPPHVGFFKILSVLCVSRFCSKIRDSQWKGLLWFASLVVPLFTSWGKWCVVMSSGSWINISNPFSPSALTHF